MKKTVILISIALIHFGMSVLIVPLTMSAASAMNTAQSGPTYAIRALVVATGILHFPIITLSWYSRYWFPGGWIHIPMMINSFLWAGGICLLVMAGRKILGR